MNAIKASSLGLEKKAASGCQVSWRRGDGRPVTPFGCGILRLRTADDQVNAKLSCESFLRESKVVFSIAQID